MFTYYLSAQCTGQPINVEALPIGVCVILGPGLSGLATYQSGSITATTYTTTDCSGPGTTSPASALTTTCTGAAEYGYYGGPYEYMEETFSTSLNFPVNGFYAG